MKTRAMKKGKIEAIKNTEIHKITSGQVIIDLKTAVKELLENSLDANANKIEIVFKNYGLEAIECSDNGEGISEENFSDIGNNHHTSKLSTFEDVSRVTSFGFRGEAISSLCQMSNISIITTVDGPKAHKLMLNRNGLQSHSICSRSKGTTVQISNLFDSLPVRKKEFLRNYKRQFSKCIELIQCYAIIQTSVKIAVSNVLPSGRKSLMLSSTGNSDIKKNLVSIFGSAASKGLHSINLDFTVSGLKNSMLSHQTDTLSFDIKVRGEISQISFGCGRIHKDRQFIYINKRPVDHAKIVKCINECYQSFNSVQFPAFVLDFQISPSFLDINVTPDKRTINIHFEEFVIDALYAELQRNFEKQSIILPKSENEMSYTISLNEKKIPNDRPQSIPEREDASEANIISKTTEIERTEGENIPSSEQFEEISSQNLRNGEGRPGTNREITTELFKISQPNDKIKPNKSLNIDSAENRLEKRHQNNASSLNGNTTATVISSDSRLRNENDCDDYSNKSTAEPCSDVNLNPSKRPRLSGKKNHLLQLNTFAHESDMNVEIVEPVDSSDEVIVEIDDVISSQPASRDKNDKLFIHSPYTDSVHESCPDSNHSHENDVEELDAGGDEIEYQSSTDEANDEESEESLIDDSPSKRLLNLPHHTLVSNKQKSNRFELTNQLEYRKVFCSEHISTLKKMVNEIEMDKLIKHERLFQEIASIDNREKAENYLTLTVDKDDFRKMKIVGQFNLGFIIVTRENEATFDMFIVDQHASDEKYNFEMLQTNTVFKSQKLLAPKPLELSVIDELLVMEYIDVFTKNGFKIQISPDDEPGSRVKLVSFPVSKNTTFTEQDFHELIHLIRENDGHNMSNIRCSKIRSMFAMRACRSSIMVGRPLSERTMTKVVHNLSQLEKPWNCPHGRPTMRHLMELKDWDAFQDDYIV